MIWDERIEESLRNHDAYENGKDEGFYNGVEQGIEQKQTEMILNMYNKKMSLEDISEISNISIEKVQSIIKNNTENN